LYLYPFRASSSMADRAVNIVHGDSSLPHSNACTDAHDGGESGASSSLPRCSSASAVLHLLATPLLHFGLPLAGCSPGLRHARSILVATPHARIRRPGQPDTVHGNGAPEDPRPVAEKGDQQQHTVRPVGDVPQVLGQALGLEVLAGALDGAVGGIDGARLLLEEEIDKELRGGEGEVEKERSAGEACAEEEGAEEPEDEVGGEGEEEGLVEAARVGRGERFDCFLRRLAPANPHMPGATHLRHGGLAMAVGRTQQKCKRRTSVDGAARCGWFRRQASEWRVVPATSNSQQQAQHHSTHSSSTHALSHHATHPREPIRRTLLTHLRADLRTQCHVLSSFTRACARELPIHFVDLAGSVHLATLPTARNNDLHLPNPVVSLPA
jgi:hypothetical protein